MKRLYLIIFSFYIIISQNYDLSNSKGVIVLQNYNRFDLIKIYNLENDSICWEFSLDDSLSQIYKYPKGLLIPFESGCDGFFIVFDVKSFDKKYYTIYSIKDQKTLKRIKRNDPLFKFVNWDKYIIIAPYTIGWNQNDNPLLKNIADYKNKITIPNIKDVVIYFDAISTKNDWLKLKWIDPINNKNKIGWIKWREKNKLLISFWLD